LELKLRTSKENKNSAPIVGAQLEPSTTGQCLVLAVGELKMTVDPLAGGRIVSFALGLTELLTPASVHPDNYGSTFWDSPQSNWVWPPRATLDSAPYSVVSSDGAVELLSRVDASGLQFSKRFQASAAHMRFEIDYHMVNRSNAPIKAGPWEITRVAGGLSFFPYENVPGLPDSALEPVSYSEGVCWYAFDAAYLAKGRKLFSGAREGWLAHVGPDRSLFIKTFPDTQPQDYAPEQGEVEIWGHDAGAYVELENHGVYRELKPGESHSYRVNWYLSRLPVEIALVPGNPELVRFVRRTLGLAD